MADRPHLTFRVLGPVEICTGDGTVLTPARRRERTLLGVLLLESGRAVTVDRLSELLWDGDPPAHAQQSVRIHVARLRALLAKAGAAGHGVALVSDRGAYRLDAPAGMVDAQRFQALVEAAARAGDLTEREGLLREAVGLWRGPVMGNAVAEGLRYRLCSELEDRRLHATEELMATGLALGRHRELAPELARLCAEHPVRQRLVELRMLALHRDGRPAEALEAYRQARQRLARDVGREPGPALQRLHTAILRGEPVPEPAAAPATGPGRTAEPRGPDGSQVTPSQLPAAQARFIGRTGHLRQLDRLLSGHSGRGPVATIAGPAGIGKTSLAVYWAHEVRHRFPDGQLFVNLRGFGPTDAAMAPWAAIRSFLDALEVPADRMPPDRLAQVELYRSLVADKRMLIVLDNARDPDQVRPLLPGASGCLTLVTSRTQLTGLAAGAAEPLALDLLPVEEARQMLAARLGADRVRAEPAAVDDIIASCAGLPLALAIAAAHAALRPHHPLAAVAADLREAHRTLDALATEDVSADVRAVFSWTYRALRPPTARLFRLIGLHPAPHVATAAAASAAGVPLADVQPMLAELTQVHLLDESAPATGPGREAEPRGPDGSQVTMHDLLRAYAIEQAGRHDTEPDRGAARLRIVDHYLHTGYAAALLLDPHREPVPVDPPEPGTVVAELADGDQAAAWFAAERQVLLAVFQRTVDAELSGRTVKLAWCLADFLDRRGHWQDLVEIQAAALDAAHRTGEPTTLALAHRELALAYIRLARYDESEAQLRHALAIYDTLSDHLGQAHTHQNIARLYERQGRNPEGLDHSRQALELYRLAGSRHGEAITLNAIGWRLAQLGDHHEALRYCEQALVLLEELDDRYGQAATWDSIGYARHHLGRHDEAIACYERAIALFREVGDRYCEAETVAYVGDLHDASGAADAARQAWQYSLEIFDELGHPDAVAVRDKLRTADP